MKLEPALHLHGSDKAVIVDQPQEIISDNISLTVTDDATEKHAEVSKPQAILYPSKYSNGITGLKYVGLVEVLKQIPEGQIITEKVLLNWLGDAYNIKNLCLLSEELPRPYIRDNTLPFHRFLSTKGLVDAFYVQKLKDEGHNVAETNAGNGRVLDYKETMVDVKKLHVPDKDLAIGNAEHFLNFISDNIRMDVEQEMRMHGFLK